MTLTLRLNLPRGHILTAGRRVRLGALTPGRRRPGDDSQSRPRRPGAAPSLLPTTSATPSWNTPAQFLAARRRVNVDTGIILTDVEPSCRRNRRDWRRATSSSTSMAFRSGIKGALFNSRRQQLVIAMFMYILVDRYRIAMTRQTEQYQTIELLVNGAD